MAGEISSRWSWTGYDVDVGMVTGTGNQFFTFFSLLALQKAEGFDQIVFVAVSTVGELYLVHSLFLVREGGYNKGILEFWGIQGEVPLEGNPQLRKLIMVVFRSNNNFFDTDME